MLLTRMMMNGHSPASRKRTIVGRRERRMLMVNSLLYGAVALIMLWPDLARALGGLIN